jgi:hypothetical protein
MTDNILEYKEWCLANGGIPISKRLDEYNEYLQRQLITTVEEATEEYRNRTKNMYLGFLKRITNLYKDDADILALNDIIDYDDPKNLALLIKVLTDKIRDIAFFYNHKRRTIKNQKTIITRKGTSVGIEKVIYDLFVDKYTINENYQDPTIDDDLLLGGIVDGDYIRQNFDIEIEELYNVSSQIPINN